MDRSTDYVIGAICGLVLFFGIGLLVASAYTSAWQKDCDKLGATVVDDVAYKCERIPGQPEPQK